MKQLCNMRMKNNPICQNTRRRAQMARWRAEHPGYMSAAARRHKELRAQKLQQQEQQVQTETIQDTVVPEENAQEQAVPMDAETGEQ